MPISLPEARALYDSGAPVAHVAAALGLKVDAFRRLRQKHGWPMRPSPIVKQAAVSQPKLEVKPAKTCTSIPMAASTGQTTEELHELNDATPEGAEPPVNLPVVRRQVAEAAQSELSKVQKTLSSGKTEDVERNARLLASLVKSLAELRRLEALDPMVGARDCGVEGQDDERPPRDLETLRNELARALERMSGDAPGTLPGE